MTIRTVAQLAPTGKRRHRASAGHTSGFADGLCGNLLGDALNRAICRSSAAGVTMSDSDGAGGALGGAPTCRTGEVDDRHASFSNFADPTDAGGQAHMVAAPGVCIESTWLGGG